MLRRHLTPILLSAAFAALFLVPAFSALLTDWWWFGEIGYRIVFTRELITRVLLFLAAGGLTFGVLYLNLRAAQRGLVPNPVVFQLAPGAQRVDVSAVLRRLSLPVSLGFGLLAGLAAAPAWDLVLRVIHRTPFGISDPVFSRDIGFYVFTLPGLTAALGFLTTLAVISLLLLIPLYWMRGDIVLGPRRLVVEPSAGLHLALLLAATFLLTALRLWLVEIPSLLYSTTGPLTGASYSDLYARLPALRVSAVAAVLAAVAIAIGGIRRRLPRYGLLAIAGYWAVAVLGRGLFPMAVQKFVVAPTELTRETPYLRHHIAATRQAWGLDSVEVRELAGEAGLTLADIRANGPTIENVRLWDREPLLQTFGQL
ncbi:MAG TPA: UPF0182 family protein, partial [Gemmatimonadales bacterium]|nr:UPF0182 family protein [Gemmatimonadales bacterium]